MKTSTIASLALALGMLVACGGNVSLGANGGQLQKGEKCTTCTGPVQEDARLCSDGTGLGRECLSQGDGTCSYDFPACPGDTPVGSPGSKCTTCTGPVQEDAMVCPDGTSKGRECLYRAGGTCGYDFPACGGGTDGGPAPGDCSAPLACGNGAVPTIAKQCSDGTAVGYSCNKQSNGTCGYSFACPGDLCQPGECTGPAPGAPNFICPDGSVGGPVCGRNSASKCGYIMRACPALDAGSAPDAR